MATKQDMIDKIDATFRFVEKNLVVRPMDFLKGNVTRQVFIAQVYEVEGDRVHEKGFSFIVFDEGKAGEEAFWLSAGDPAPSVPEPTFREEMVAWIESKFDVQVGSYIIRHLESMTANEATERGVASLILEDEAGDSLHKSALVWKDAQGDFQWQVIKE